MIQELLDKLYWKIWRKCEIVDTDAMFYTYEYCQDCGFTYRYSNHKSFRVNANNELIESQSEYDKDNFENLCLKLNGKIRFTYCPNCERYIKIFTIIDNLIEEQGPLLLYYLIKKEKNYFIIIEEEENSLTSIQCPKCQSKLKNKIQEGSSCPICGGKISGKFRN